jgi:hypothetical protein
MASAYGDRSWLRLHQPGKPADITPEHFDALTMWRSGLNTLPAFLLLVRAALYPGRQP